MGVVHSTLTRPAFSLTGTAVRDARWQGPETHTPPSGSNTAP